MGRFINPFTDTGFKRIFGQEFSKPVLIEFLNALLAGERHITDVTFLDKEQLGLYDEERSVIYDVLCETTTGEKIIVEMQNRFQAFFRERSIYYAARAIVEQGLRGRQWDYDLKAVYLVAFMDFHLTDTSADKFRIDVALMDMDTHTVFSDKVRMVFLQLPHFNKQEADCHDTFDRMIYVLKNMDVFDRMPWAAKNSVFERMAEIAQVAHLTEKERYQYEADVKSYRDTLAVMNGQYQQGHAEGVAEGRAEGEARGRHEGRLSVARAMKAGGLPPGQIAQFTGLTPQEVEKL